jgi:hypothetical protein
MRTLTPTTFAELNPQSMTEIYGGLNHSAHLNISLAGLNLLAGLLPPMSINLLGISVGLALGSGLNLTLVL